MILHFMIYDKFMKDYIDRINKLYDHEEHCFIIYGDKIHDGVKTVNGSNVILINAYKGRLKKYSVLLSHMFTSKKIIIHSLFFDKRILKLWNILSPILGKKYVWFIWGGDLYDRYYKRNENVKYEQVRKKFISRLHTVVVVPKGDYDFLLSHYKTNAAMKQAVYSYILPEYELNSTNNIPTMEKKSIKILLANSATKTCQYEDALNKLKNLGPQNVEIFCVLSYPKNEGYIKEITELGYSLFGSSFKPVTNFMDDLEYTSFLSDMDIVIFNHNRQQAIGNIIKTLYLGKKVFINPLNTGLDFFKEIGCEVFSTNELEEHNLCEMSIEDAENNKKVILKYCSDENFMKMWNRVFYN